MFDNRGVGHLSRVSIVTAVVLLAVCVGVQLRPAHAEARAELKPRIGWGPLTSRQAAAKVQRTKWEPRRQNAKQNNTVATAKQLRYFRANSDMPYAKYVNGQFKGTTDDIIEWAAYKWGLPEDVLRAVAVNESYWEQDHVNVGDRYSYGLFQVRTPYHCCLPQIQTSTAFNADYYAGIIRAYFDGEQDWLNNPDVAPENGRPYRPGDLWGSIGAWYSGRWHIPANEEYVADIKAWLAIRKWLDPFFDDNFLSGGRAAPASG